MEWIWMFWLTRKSADTVKWSARKDGVNIMSSKAMKPLFERLI